MSVWTSTATAPPDRPTEPAAPRAISRRLAQRLASGAALLSGLVGAVALVLALRPTPTPTPLTQPDELVGAIQHPAGFALLTLAGYPTQQIVEQAVALRVPGAALPSLLADTTQSDAALLAALQTMAAASENAHTAASLAVLAADVARLSPDLSDSERAMALIALGSTLWGQGYDEAAASEWHQAIILLRSSPDLSPAEHSTAVTALAQALDAAGEQSRAKTVRAIAAPAGQRLFAPAPRTSLLPASLPPMPAALVEAATTRQRAALTVAQRIVAGERPDYAPLLQALIEEGRAREAWAERLRGEGLPLAQQATLLEAEIGWLLQAQFLARSGDPEAGGSWQSRRPAIDQELSAAWQHLHEVRLQQMAMLSTKQEADGAHAAWLMHRLLATRLLRDPNHDPARLWAELHPIQRTAPHVGLRLVWRTDGSSSGARPWRVPPAFTDAGLPPR